MSETASSFDRRYVRSSDRSVIGGVCGGLAEYFGFNLKVTRALAIVAFIINPLLATLAYIAIVVLVPAKPTTEPAPRVDQEFRKSLRSSPTKTMGDVRRRFQALDRRLAALEKYITSSRYDLDREFRDLENK